MSDSITLKYSFSAKPILADRDGEAVVNWVNGGNHSVTADATHVHSGTKSFKLHSTGVGDTVTNFISLASGNNATFVVGKTYCIPFWVYSATLTGLIVATGGVADSFTIPAGVWTYIAYTFTATDTITALKLQHGSDTTDLWFELGVVCSATALPILIEKGLTVAEKYGMFPQIVNEYVDGSKDTQYKALIRKMTLTTDVLVATQLSAYARWNLDNARLIDYDIDGVQETDLVFIPPSDQEVQWYDEFKMTPYLVFNMDEGIARDNTSLPANW
jgi:hypothetical protein